MKYKTYIDKVTKLNQWIEAYYAGNPIATDDEYDTLYREVQTIEDANKFEIHPDTPTRRVGHKQVDIGCKHLSRMWSLDNVFNTNGMQKWIDPDALYRCEGKFDGASLNIIYEGGVLKQILTRGDGEIGTDVTILKGAIRGIPIVIKWLGLLEVRGEVVIKKSDFEEIKESQKLSSARNAVAGGLRSLDVNVAKMRRMCFYPYEVGKTDMPITDDIIDKVIKLGFPSMPFLKTVRGSEVEKTYRELLEIRDGMELEYDGMVVKHVDRQQRERLGYTQRAPRWAIAYKFPADEKVTSITGVKLQVGRTGVITPIAILTPVNFNGVNVGKATLHNYTYIEEGGYKIGGEVILTRSGDVIPKIVKALTERYTGNERDITIPKQCPVCDEDTTITEKHNVKTGITERSVMCTNPQCPNRTIRMVSHYGGRKNMHINGLGPSMVKKLYKKGLVKNLPDLYRLEPDGTKTMDNLINAINATKGCPLSRLLGSIGIDGMGQTTAKRIVSTLGGEVQNYTKDTLLTVEGIGEDTANDIDTYLTSHLPTIIELIGLVNPTV